jgi:hypothetical protein
VISSNIPVTNQDGYVTIGGIEWDRDHNTIGDSEASEATCYPL